LTTLKTGDLKLRIKNLLVVWLRSILINIVLYVSLVSTGMGKYLLAG